MAHLPGQGSWGTKLGGYASFAVEAPSFIPLLGGLYDYGRAAFHGDGGGMLLAVGSLGADLFTGGTAGVALRAEGKVAAKAYSVVFETTIEKTGKGFRPEHKLLANRGLAEAMSSSKELSHTLSNLGVQFPVGRNTPADFQWHHAVDRPGVMQLVPATQHTPGSIFQGALHPGGSGGYAEWGKTW